MAICDLCSSEIDLSTIPWAPNNTVFVALGLPVDAYETQWKELVLAAKTDWACCSRCYPVVQPYLRESKL
jgi:hypothetical protein